MNELTEQHAPDSASGAHHQGVDQKSRPVHDRKASEATRELRDTSRRRRDAEEKLQQHLIQAKDHVPHHHDREAPENAPQEDPGQDHAAQGDAPQEADIAPQEEDPEGGQEKDSEGVAR